MFALVAYVTHNFNSSFELEHSFLFDCSLANHSRICCLELLIWHLNVQITIMQWDVHVLERSEIWK